MSEFYSMQTESSKVKTSLVVKYFDAWSRIMWRKKRIGYLDLFSGPGRYEDGKYSTPVLITKHVVSDPVLSKKMILGFNDSNERFIESLKSNIFSLSGFDNLEHQPIFSNETIDENYHVHFSDMKLIPTLTFIDPWGYKGITLNLIKSLNKDKGCESIIFFNFNRINTSISNPIVKDCINGLFGAERLENILDNLNGLDSSSREEYIINEFSAAIKNLGIPFILPFRFNMQDKNRTSHYIIFISKHSLGYKIMKDIMARESRDPISNIGTFEYIPSNSNLNFLDQFEYNIENLKNLLVEKYSNAQERQVKTIFWENLKGNPYVLCDFQKALLELEEEGKILVRTEKTRRPKNSMAEHLWITFV